MNATNTYVYSASECQRFLCDNMRNALREIIREHGLDPSKLMDQWSSWIEKGVKTWLASGHLTEINIEFYPPGATAITTRWDFPITYSGSGVDDDMWSDKDYLRQLISKAPKPTSNCVYRVLLTTKHGHPLVDGISDVECMSTGNLVARSAGTIVSTGHVRASATYWTK